MNTLIRIRGWVHDCHLQKPHECVAAGSVKYSLAIQPEHPGIYDELEALVLPLKREHESPYRSQKSTYDDQLFDDCLVLFETLHQPTLVGELSNFEVDDQLIGSFVQVVGHIQIHKLGNVFLSAHLIEPALRSCNGFDPVSR